MTKKYFDGVIPKPGDLEEIDKELIEKANSVINSYSKNMDEFKFNIVLTDIWALLDNANAYINKTEPWNLFKAEKIEKLQTIIYNLNEVIRIIGILISPFISETAEKIESIYNQKITTLDDAKYGILVPGFKLLKDNLILFNKIKIEDNIKKE